MSEPRTEWNIVLQLNSPMQIGAGTLGMVEKTEMFIPGRVIWGALTASLTQTICHKPQFDQFAEVGEQLGSYRNYFSTFFPSFDLGTHYWLPVFLNSDLQWQKIGNSGFLPEFCSNTEMQSFLMTGISSNATDPTRMATSESSLHETDCISPVSLTATGEMVPVCFVGRIQLPEKICCGDQEYKLNKENISSLVNRSRLGGGRKRGLGIVKPLSINSSGQAKEKEDIGFLKYNEETWLLTGDNCPVEEYQTDTPVRGRAYLATNRLFSREKGAGRSFSSQGLCWHPGTLIPKPLHS